MIRWALAGLAALSLAAAPALTGGAAMAGGAAAAGGAGPVGGSPRDGAILATAPATVDLTFPSAPDASLSHVSVRRAGGDDVGSGDLEAAGTTLRQPVRITENGEYAAAYHVVFADGGEVIGAVRFTVGTGLPPSADPVALTAAVRSTPEHEHGVDPLGGALLLIDVLVLGGVLALLFLRRPGQRTLEDARRAIDG